MRSFFAPFFGVTLGITAAVALSQMPGYAPQIGNWCPGGACIGNIDMQTHNISNVGTLGGTTIGGTLSTAAQPNVTSLGTLTGLTMGGDISMVGNDITNVDDLYGTPVLTDVAPRVTVIGTQPPLVSAATAASTNINGANLVFAPAAGSIKLVCAANPCVFADGQTITTTMQINGVVTTSAKTAGGGAGQFACNGLTPAVCACNLYATYVATPVVGLTVTRLDGTCSNGVLAYSNTPGAGSQVGVVSSAAGIGVTSGLPGQILLPAGLVDASHPRLSFVDNTGSGISEGTSNQLIFMSNGTQAATVSSSYLTTNNVHFNAGSQYLTDSWGPLQLGAACATGATTDTCTGGKYAAKNTPKTLGAGATTFAATTNYEVITGDSGGNTVATITGGIAGMVLYLQFVDDKVTITDTGTGAADTVNLSAAFTSSADDTLTLISNGTSWRELARSVN